MTATNEHTNGCSIQIGDSAPVPLVGFDLKMTADALRADHARILRDGLYMLGEGVRVEPVADGPIRDLYVAAWWLLSRLDRGWQPSQIEREIATLRRAVNAVNAADPDGIGR